MSDTPHIPEGRGEQWTKLVRYAHAYGWKRAVIKALGRTRYGSPAFLFSRRRKDRSKKIGIIGCGQFAYSTICYFLREELNPDFAAVYDINPAQAQSLAGQYRARKISPSAEALIRDPEVEVVYIASDHASHAPYAIAALKAGKTVYTEKPAATTMAQLKELMEAAGPDAQERLFVGYNRPYAPAVQELKRALTADPGPFTLQCSIHTHVLPPDHWYRDPEQGSRICGNMGHWLDLTIHLLHARGHLPATIDIALSWANDAERDDNISVVLSTPLQDLITITMSARHEPFEGINEQLRFQNASVAAAIDDFRRLTLTQGSHVRDTYYHPKDQGHRLSVLQPFMPASARDLDEVFLSTRLMLKIAGMVQEGIRLGSFRV